MFSYNEFPLELQESEVYQMNPIYDLRYEQKQHWMGDEEGARGGGTGV